MINQGRLLSLSPKSGHYKPGADSIYRILHWLHAQDVTLSGLPIITAIERNSKNYYDAYQVLLQKGKTEGLHPIAHPRLAPANEYMQPNQPPVIPKIVILPTPLSSNNYLNPRKKYMPPIINHVIDKSKR